LFLKQVCYSTIINDADEPVGVYNPNDGTLNPIPVSVPNGTFSGIVGGGEFLLTVENISNEVIDGHSLQIGDIGLYDIASDQTTLLLENTPIWGSLNMTGDVVWAMSYDSTLYRYDAITGILETIETDKNTLPFIVSPIPQP